MKFEVGDFVEHCDLPHIWKITRIWQPHSPRARGLNADLALVWSPDNPGWAKGGGAPTRSLAAELFRNITKNNWCISLKDLQKPSNEMLVIALELDR